MKICAALLMLVAASCVAGQQPASDFVLVPSKPYVYLQFDHVGPRKPIQEGETKTGLWLRIVNNCRVPIMVPTFGLTTGDPGVGVLDEVVSNTPMLTVFSEQNEVNSSGESSSGDSKPKQPAATAGSEQPLGYSAEVFSMTRLLPGKEMLFSVPIDHVGDRWFMRVRFVLDVENPRSSVEPNSYLTFFKAQIPAASVAGSLGTGPGSTSGP